MKRTVALILTMITTSFSSHAAPADWRKLVTGNNVFAFNLLHELSTNQPASNIFISPYSAAMALQMAAGGAGGRTLTEMQQLLGTTAMSADSIGEDNRQLTQMFGSANKDVIMETANALWCQKNFTIKKDFIHNSRRNFGATVADLDFSDPHSVEVINAWASDRTHGKITHFADGMLDPLVRVFLANAVYFKGKWADPFKPAATLDEPFHLLNGGQKSIPLMAKTKKFSYLQGDGYQAVRLPYQGGNLGMYVFLPDTNSSLEKLFATMDETAWRSAIKPAFAERSGTLKLPRFKMDYTVELAGPLQALGMKTAFDPLAADFSGIAPELYISAVRQKTFVEVKEEGTEAAAVTGIAVRAAGIMMPPADSFTMIVNRAFLFLIEDNQTGVILFMGAIYDPSGN